VPYLEEPQTGFTSLFTRELSQKLGCFVVAGFPETLRQDEEHPGQLIGANSAIIYDPNGNYVGEYRKTNLFEADLPWVKPGKRHPAFCALHPLKVFKEPDMRALRISCIQLQPSHWVYAWISTRCLDTPESQTWLLPASSLPSLCPRDQGY